jgi:hypothetical protein
LPEEAERDGRLGGSARLGNNVYRKIAVADGFQYVRMVCCTQVGSGKYNVEMFFSAAAKREWRSGLTELKGGLGAEIRAANADNDQYFALFSNPFGCRFDPFKLRPIVFYRQVQPSEKCIAGAAARFQEFRGCGNLRFNSGYFVFSNKLPGCSGVELYA